MRSWLHFFSYLFLPYDVVDSPHLPTYFYIPSTEESKKIKVESDKSGMKERRGREKERTSQIIKLNYHKNVDVFSHM